MLPVLPCDPSLLQLSEESQEKLSKFVRQELAAQYVAARISLEQEADEAGQHQRRKVVLLKLAGA